MIASIELTASTVEKEKKTKKPSALDDSVRVYPKKMSSHTTLEKIVNVPGTVLNLPFRLFFGAIGKTAGFVYESPSTKWVRDLAFPRIRIRGVQVIGSNRSGFGVRLYHRDLLGQGSQVQARFSHGFFDKRQKHYFRILDVPLGNRVFGSTFVQYRFLAEESFFGLGPNSRFENESEYAMEKITARAQIGPQVGKNSRLQFFTEFNQFELFDALESDAPSLTDVPADSLPGLSGRTKIQSFGVTISHDSRNYSGLTTTGWEVEASASLNSQIQGDAFRYLRFFVDAKRHLHLFYLRRLTLRFAVESNQPLNNRDVPFYNLSSFGRRETMRGYTRGRFRDKDVIFGSMEYRYPIWRFLDWMWFMDYGQAAPNILEEFDLQNFALTGGGGLIMRTRDARILQILFGVSKDRARLYFVLR